MNADGSDRRQLTSGSEDDYNPSPSPDGRFVTFTSTRGDGPSHVWRVDVDGSNLKQLTFGDIEDTNRFITPDGKWVLFNSFRGGKYNVWKLPLDGGEPIQMSKELGITALSPDGKLMACFDLFQQSGRMKISILRVENGETTKVIELPADIAYDNFGWTADGHALTTFKSTDGVDNLWTLPLDGSPPKQLTQFTDSSMNNFGNHAPSQDGKQVAITRVTENTQLVLITDFK